MATVFPSSMITSINRPLDEKSNVLTIEKRNAIPMAQRYRGMIVVVQNEGDVPPQLFWLPTDDLMNTGWIGISMQSGVIEAQDVLYDNGLFKTNITNVQDAIDNLVEVINDITSSDGRTAQQVEIGEDIPVTNCISPELPVGSTVSTNDSVWDVLKKILNPNISPTYIQPVLTLSGSVPLQHEIGEFIMPELTPTWVQNDAGVLIEYRLRMNGTVIHTDFISSIHIENSFQLTENVTYNAQAEYGQGIIKEDSDGELKPLGRIEAGTITSNNVNYMPQRKAFFGHVDSDEDINTSDYIRELADSLLNPVSGTKLNITVPVGRRGMCFAYPAILPSPSSIIQQSLNFDIKESFSFIIVSVDGANGYTGVDYRIYYLVSEFAYPIQETFILTI